MIVKLLTEHHLEFLSLKGGYTGLSESTLVKMPHCWKSHVTSHLVKRNKDKSKKVAQYVTNNPVRSDLMGKLTFYLTSLMTTSCCPVVALDFEVDTLGLGVVPFDLGVAPLDLGVLGVEACDFGVATASLGVDTLDLGVLEPADLVLVGCNWIQEIKLLS